MKGSVLFFSLFLFVLASSTAQRTSEFGGFLGRAYYLGEINPKTHVGNNVGSLNYGLIFRYNLNKRYSLKASALRSKLVGEDQLAEFQFNRFRKSEFKTNITELSGQIEFNFLPYETGDKLNFFSPYIFLGLAYYYYNPSIQIDGVDVNETESESGNGYSFPFGLGLKLSTGSRFSLAFEWGFRKTSNDALDGLPNRSNEFIELGKEYDNDWYVMSGFMLTYKLTKVGPCPAYNF